MTHSKMTDVYEGSLIRLFRRLEELLRQIAQAADNLGYEGVLIPTGRSCEDPWVVASSLLPVTKRLKFLVAVRRPAPAQPGRAHGRDL